MLLNARRRRKTARRTRRTRRNPSMSMVPYRDNFPKSMGPKQTKRSYSGLKIKRFKLGNRMGLSVRARKIYVSRKGRRALITARNPFGSGNIMSQVKNVFSKENLTVAAGGVAATLVTNYLMAKRDATTKKPLLPMPTDADNVKMAKVGYAVGIPLLGAIVTRRFNAGLSKGMVFGALINGIIEGFKQYGSAQNKALFGMGAFSEYLDYTPMSTLNETPSYSAINQFKNIRPMNSAFSNSSAFPSDAWGR